jgi:hypothetical protein
VAILAFLQFGLVLLLFVAGVALLVKGLLEANRLGLGILVLDVGMTGPALLRLLAFLGLVVTLGALAFELRQLLVLVMRKRLYRLFDFVDVYLDNGRAIVRRERQADKRAGYDTQRKKCRSGFHPAFSLINMDVPSEGIFRFSRSSRVINKQKPFQTAMKVVSIDCAENKPFRLPVGTRP